MLDNHLEVKISKTEEFFGKETLIVELTNSVNGLS